MAAQTPPSKQTSADTASRQKRRHLDKYQEDAAGKYTKVRNMASGRALRALCEWDRDSVGNVFVFEAEAQLLEHEARCGERRKRGEYPAGGYEGVPAEQRALAQSGSEVRRSRPCLHTKGARARKRARAAARAWWPARRNRCEGVRRMSAAATPQGA